MAKIHQSKDHLGADVNRIRMGYAQKWATRVLAALLLAGCYVLLWKQLRTWGDALAAAYHAWAVTPLEAQPVLPEAWLAGLQTTWLTLVRAAEMAVRLSPLLLPAIGAGVVLWLISLLMAPRKAEK